MGGQHLRLGPFVGGLNTTSDASTIADVELAECTNFEQDLDGSLKSRPPFKEIAGHVTFTERIVWLCEAIFGTDHYVIGSNANGVFSFINGVVALITNTFEAGAAVQYADKIYLVPKPGSGNGGKWDPVGGFVAVASIPKGQSAVIHKERLYITPGIESTTNTSRLKFSDPGNFESWPASNFIDVGQGDGTRLIDLTVMQDNLLLFKQNTAFLLAYDVRPDDAVLREISSTIGVNGQFNLVNYENQVYIFSQGWVYELINYDFNRINTKVPFIRDDTVPAAFADESVFLSLLEDRIVCRYYRNVYVYSLRTRSWSEWESAEDSLHYFGPIVTIRPTSGNEYYAGSCISTNTTVIKLSDKANALDSEQAFNTTPTYLDTCTRTVSSGLGISDSGHTYTNTGGSASDYNVSGGKIRHTLGSVDVLRSSKINGLSVDNFDILATVSTDKLATGANQTFIVSGRFIDSNNYLAVLMAFTTTQAVSLSIFKIVGGAFTSLVSMAVGGLTHAIDREFTVRFKGSGSSLTAKAWQTSGSQPTAWNLTVTDGSLLAAGTTDISSRLDIGNTNVLPVTASWDNIQVIDTDLVTSVITCSARTKNFDMATSHQFKRLWWWGADISTGNSVKGIVTPITSSFVVTWDDLENYTWDDLNTWDQPLTAPSLVETIQATGVGVVKNFVKFNKALRYRQINFKVELTTVGNTVDGPAKLFSMTAVTEARQIVSKAVS
jgi:hypothetical protein